MKIISHYTNNEAYIKTLHNCEKCGEVNGYELYAVHNNDDMPLYLDIYIHIKGTKDLCARACGTYSDGLSATMEKMRELPEAQFIAYATVNGKLDSIRAAITAEQWTSNGDALFCELVGESALADKVRQNRALYLERKQEEEKRQAEEKAKHEREQQEAEQREKAKRLEQADENIRKGEFIAAADFEALCIKYSVKLPIKLLGWLREWCKTINFETYYYKRTSKQKHTSSSIWQYIGQLKQVMGA